MASVQAQKCIRVPKSCVVQTPNVLASAMVRAIGIRLNDKWLEPCVGKGALLQALSENGVKREQITGLDVDSRAEKNDRNGIVYRGTEFLSWSLSTSQRFDKIVANPPYVALERLQQRIQKSATTTTLGDDIKITRNANAWYAFLCASIRLLKPNGSLCFLLPAAWDFANYAAPLRGSIMKYFEDVEIYRTNKPIFRADHVQEGSVLLIGRRRRDESVVRIATNMKRYELADIKELTSALGRKIDRPVASARAPIVEYETQRLRSLATIRVGVVTGDSAYFLLNETRRLELGLPQEAMIPALTKAKHLVAAEMEKKEWEELKGRDERIWLFHPTQRCLDLRSVQSYLRYGQRGGCEVDNYKIAIRSPWYKVPLCARFDAFVSGMSALKPWLSFCKMPRLRATNTLYLLKFIKPLDSASRNAIALSLLTTPVREQLAERGRLYAAGLLKFEPCDLLDLLLPKLPASKVLAKDYREAVSALLSGDEAGATAIADRLIF